MVIDLVNLGIIGVMSVIAILISRWLVLYALWWWRCTINQKAMEIQSKEQAPNVEETRPTAGRGRPIKKKYN